MPHPDQSIRRQPQLLCLRPGFIENPGLPQALEQYPALKERFSRIPLSRMGKQEDIVGAVIYLASDASDYVTGANITIDGGLVSVLG